VVVLIQLLLLSYVGWWVGWCVNCVTCLQCWLLSLVIIYLFILAYIFYWGWLDGLWVGMGDGVLYYFTKNWL